MPRNSKDRLSVSRLKEHGDLTPDSAPHEVVGNFTLSEPSGGKGTTPEFLVRRPKQGLHMLPQHTEPLLI